MTNSQILTVLPAVLRSPTRSLSDWKTTVYVHPQDERIVTFESVAGEVVHFIGRKQSNGLIRHLEQVVIRDSDGSMSTLHFNGDTPFKFISDDLIVLFDVKDTHVDVTIEDTDGTKSNHRIELGNR